MPESRPASTPAKGIQRGTIAATVGGLAGWWASTQVDPAAAEIIQVGVTSILTGTLVALGKVARDSGGTFGKFIGELF
jgi:hypothetical protein